MTAVSTTDGVLLDWLGTEIIRGSLIIYPGRVGSSMWLNLGEVVEVKKVPHRWYPDRDDWRLRVCPLRSTHSSRPPERGSVVLDRLDRVTVLKP